LIDLIEDVAGSVMLVDADLPAETLPAASFAHAYMVFVPAELNV
jgi:hypothetical protein